MIVKGWVHNGMNCMIREGMFSTYNGYVQDPTEGKFGRKHPCSVYDFEVHGGITWYGELEQEGLDSVWFGFDTCHVNDFNGPALVGEPVWTLEMVEQETNLLADQVAMKVKCD